MKKFKLKAPFICKTRIAEWMSLVGWLRRVEAAKAAGRNPPNEKLSRCDEKEIKHGTT